MPYLARLEKVQKKIKEAECDALIVDDSTNLLYLTGLELSAGTLLVHHRGAELIVDGRYFEMCQKRAPVGSHPLETLPLEKLLQEPEFKHIKRIGFDQETTSFRQYTKLQELLKEIPSVSLVPTDTIVLRTRMRKDPIEIETLREAALLGSQGYDYICSLLKEGITEAEVAVELEIFWKRRGSKALAFSPIIAFGAGSSMPHYRTGNVPLRKGDTVLLDIGVNLKHYHSDMTRVLFFGEPVPQMKEIYEIVRQAQEAALDICVPGTTIGDLDDAARNLIAEAGYGDRFTHGLGHGVGLEIHELPVIRNRPPFNAIKLEPGMVITIEPGIYLPDIGGVRIEDTVVITETGHENLTQRPKELRVV